MNNFKNSFGCVSRGRHVPARDEYMLAGEGYVPMREGYMLARGETKWESIIKVELPKFPWKPKVPRKVAFFSFEQQLWGNFSP